MDFFKKILYLTSLMIIGCLGFTLNSEANEIGFAVEPIFPKNQIDVSSGYFQLLMSKGDKQVIQVKLKNSKDEKVVLNTWATSATTNVNGVVDYSDSKNEVDDSLQHHFKELIKMRKEIELQPNSEEIIDIEVTMPDNNIEGVLAGGLTFEEQKASDKQSVSSQTGIKNKFSYVIALIIQQEKQILTNPELKLEKVEASQLNGKNAISAKIRNVSDVFLNQMSADVLIKEKSTDKVILTDIKETMQMAPNSVMNYPIFLNGKKLEAGNYIYEVKVKGIGNSEEEEKLAWDLTSEFTIEKEEAKELNKTDTQLMGDNQINWVILGLVIGNLILFIIIIVFVIFFIKKSKKTHKKVRRKKKKD